MLRSLLLVHRYLGIAVCLLMAAWSLSGITMMYVAFPSLSEAGRLAGQAPLSLRGCCNLQQLHAVLDEVPLTAFAIEMVADRPVLRLQSAGSQFSVDLATAELIENVSPQLATRVATIHAAAMGAGAPRRVATIERDQWTVSGFGELRPLYKFAVRDAANTEFYVSSVTGQVVQRTTRQQRFWNYLGAVTHWIYPTFLRQRVQLWAQIVIWTSLAGVFLVVTGLYVGWVRWNPRTRRQSPYRGWALWHHLAGLLFGVLALTWVASGLISMNPWGFLEGGSSAIERERLAGMQLRGDMAVTAVARLMSRDAVPDARELRSAPLAGRLFVVAQTPTSSVRLNAETLEPAALQAEELREAALRMRPDQPLASAVMLHSEDRYYYAHHSTPPLPVFRMLLGDTEQTRYYIDPLDGSLLRKIDRQGRWWRWLFSALHQWDFSAGLRQRPVWDVVVITLLLGLATLCITGVWMGLRYVKRSL